MFSRLKDCFKKTTANTEYFYSIESAVSISSSSWGDCLNSFNAEVIVSQFKKTTERFGDEHKSTITKVRDVVSQEWNIMGGAVCPYVFKWSKKYILKYSEDYVVQDFNFKLKIDNKIMTDEKNIPMKNLRLFFLNQNNKTLKFEKRLKENKVNDKKEQALRPVAL